MQVADQVYVMEQGEIILAGEPGQLHSDSRLQQAYLKG